MSASVMRGAIVGAILLTTVVLAGCASDAPQSSTPDPVGTWGDAEAPGKPSLSLSADGKLTGTDGCNRLVGSWSERDAVIRFDDVASTRMACEGVDTWLSALTTATIDGTTMTVLDAGGDEIGVLERTGTDAPTAEPSADTAAFVGTWGEDAGGSPFLVIAADGVVNGSDGCNHLAGAWTVSGERIEFSSVAMTLMACEGVDQWLNALSTASVSGDTLTIYNADGAEIGTLARAAAAG